MQLIKHAGVALVSTPFMMMGLLMAINGARRNVVSFAAAGLILLGLMAVSAALAIGNITREGPVRVAIDLSPLRNFDFGGDTAKVRASLARL